MLKFKQCKITEEGEVKLLGTLAIRKEKISGVWSCIDRFECVVKNAAILAVEGFGPMAVEGNVDDIIEQLELPV